jgi:hypothetical protein
MRLIEKPLPSEVGIHGALDCSTTAEMGDGGWPDNPSESTYGQASEMTTG